jgi:protein TonB
MIRGARMLAAGGSAALHAAAVGVVLLLAASIRQPEPLFVDLTTGPPVGDERSAAPSTSRKPNAAPATARAAHASARTAAASAPDRSAEPAPTAAPSLPAFSREMVAPESSASNPSEDRGPSLPAAPPDTGAGAGVTSDAPSGTSQASGVAGGSRFALAGPGADRSEVPAEFGPYLAGFRRRIQELVVYPLAARRRGLAGRVEIEVILEPSGRVRDVAVVASSSHSLLDEAAIEAVRSLQPVPLPETLPRRPLRVRLPVVFDLR